MRRAALLSAAAAVLLTACAAEPATETPATEPGGATTTMAWGPLGTWTGEEGRQTESFDITSGALRLTWESRTDGPPESGRLRVSLHSAISGRPLETVVDTRAPGSDSVRFTATPRVAYLLIESEGVDWRVTLEEGALRRGADPSNRQP